MAGPRVARSERYAGVGKINAMVTALGRSTTATWQGDFVPQLATRLVEGGL